MRNTIKGSFLLSCVAVLSLITFKAEAALLVAGRGGGVLRYDEQTGAFIDTFIPVGSSGLVGASSLAIGPDRMNKPEEYQNVLDFFLTVLHDEVLKDEFMAALDAKDDEAIPSSMVDIRASPSWHTNMVIISVGHLCTRG